MKRLISQIGCNIYIYIFFFKFIMMVSVVFVLFSFLMINEILKYV